MDTRIIFVEHPTVPYTILNDPDNEFRLLSVKPRQYHPSIQLQNVEVGVHVDVDVDVYCELETVAYLRGLPYIALSYSWGSSTETRPISIGNQVCNISANLEEAIRLVRDEKEDVLLWCDQLCINQRDSFEKSKQVQRMFEVYSDALKVIAWIGPSADDSDLCIQRLKSMGRADFTNDVDGMANFVAMYEDGDQNLKLAFAFDQFCRRSYWKRLWILQEFAVAKEVQVTCGTSSISYEELRWATIFANAIGPWAKQNTHDIDPLVRDRCLKLYNCYQSSSRSFLWSVVTCREAHLEPADSEWKTLFQVIERHSTLEIDYNHPQCSDPRDRVFSFLGLANDAAQFTTFPDYTKTYEDVYEEVARQFLRQGYIDILAYCQFPRTISDREMATWAPDWNMPTKKPHVHLDIPTFNGFFVCGTNYSPDRQHVEFPDSKRLSLVGIPIDTIKAVSGLWDPDWLSVLEPRDTLTYLSELFNLCSKSKRMEHDEALLHRDVARIAISDLMSADDDEKQQACLEALQELSAALKDINAQPLREGEQEELRRRETMDLVYARMLIRLHSRRPVIAQTGYIGLAPHHVEVGDEICIFLGGKTPYIVRPVGIGEYILIGEAYVHGIMYGEYMEGEPQEKLYVLR